MLSGRTTGVNLVTISVTTQSQLALPYNARRVGILLPSVIGPNAYTVSLNPAAGGQGPVNQSSAGINQYLGRCEYGTALCQPWYIVGSADMTVTILEVIGDPSWIDDSGVIL